MNLTEKERLFLYNQYEVLRILNSDDEHESKRYENFQKIVVRGYEDVYDWLTDGFDKTVPSEVTQFVFDVLNLYRALMVSYHELSDEEKAQIDENDIKYEGFDGSNEIQYYCFADFLMRDEGLYGEIFDDGRAELDSHAKRVDQYKKMLDAWRNTGKEKHDNLTAEEIRGIIESYKIR